MIAKLWIPLKLTQTTGMTENSLLTGALSLSQISRTLHLGYIFYSDCSLEFSSQMSILLPLHILRHQIVLLGTEHLS